MPSPLAAIAICGGRRGVAREIAVGRLQHDLNRIEFELEAQPFGRRRRPEFAVLVVRCASAREVVVDQELDRRSGSITQAEIAAFEQRAIVQQVDQPDDAAALLVESAGRGR